MGLIDNIKSEAKGNCTKIQSSDAAALEKILNKMFYLEKDIEGETEFVRHVMTRGAETQERRGLHASAIIVGEKDYCARQQVLSLLYKQLQGEQVNVGLKRIFEEGNAVHEKWQRLFVRAGYSTAHDLDETQFCEKYMVSFTPDIICNIPEFHDGPMIGEIKSVNTHQFKKMARHPSAWKQLQMYMLFSGIHKGFVLCDDKNTQEFKLEVYDFDSSLVAPYLERLDEIVYYYNRVKSERKMIKRPSNAIDPTCKRCEKCPMRDACWNIGIGRIPLD